MLSKITNQKGEENLPLNKSNMKEIILEKGQYLSDVMTEIPSNCIIFKNVTGIGATTLELQCNRNSIIIEPNVPVIVGKEAKHQNVLGVFKGVTVEKIIKYIKDPKIEHKKIVTTPESFGKVISAFSEVNLNIFDNYFLLYDECDRLCKDADFRESITSPLSYFFLFKAKTLISATAIRPSDPRFLENGFEYISILPNYSIEKEVSIITTNNPYLIAKKIFEKNKVRKHFIFMNSTNAIEKMISFLKIESKSAIFCSDKALEKISSSVEYSSSTLDEDSFQEYNFFTSRFFSAVDIDIDYDCNVYLISDVWLATHSAIDPRTDAVQIIGRFRNKGININTYIISNTDLNLNCKTPEEANKFINHLEGFHTVLTNYRRTTNDKILNEVLDLTIKTLPFNTYLNDKGDKCYFKIDNYMYDNRVLSYYLEPSTLRESYEDCCIINTDRKNFNVSYTNTDYPFDSSMIAYRRIFTSFKKMLEAVLTLLVKIDSNDYKEENINVVMDLKETFRLFHPDVYEAYQLGIPIEDIMGSLSIMDVKTLIKQHKTSKDRQSFDFIEELREMFPVNSEFTGDALKEKLAGLIKKHNLSLKATIQEAKNFFEISNRFKGKGDKRNVWFYKILAHR